MNCTQIHDILNASVGGGKLAYSEMTPKQIAELLSKADCPIARSKGESLRSGNSNIDPLKSQGYALFHCPLARSGKFGGIIKEVNCHATDSSCVQNGAHGDLELGISVEVVEEYPEH